MAIIELKNVCKIYNLKEQSEIRALDNLSLSLNEGEFLVIRGVSGSGKSTLLHMMGLLDVPTSGEVLIEGINCMTMSDSRKAHIRNELLGFVLQDFGLIEYRSVFENCMVPLYFSKKRTTGDKKRIMDALALVGMQDLCSRQVRKLSGGQKQRVAIARAMVNDPKIILADEPTGQLDSKTKEEICSLFENVRQNGKTIVVVTHDEELETRATRVIHLKDGRIEQ